MISDRKADSATVESLIRQLEQRAQNTALPLEKRIQDTAIWWFRNQGRIGRENVQERLRFIEKTLEIFIEIMALSLDRIQHAERFPSANILMPRLEIKGDLTKLG